MIKNVHVCYLQSDTDSSSTATKKETFSIEPNAKQFNQYVLWQFEGLQSLVGSDLEIFNSNDGSQLSLTLR